MAHEETDIPPSQCNLLTFWWESDLNLDTVVVHSVISVNTLLPVKDQLQCRWIRVVDSLVMNDEHVVCFWYINVKIKNISILLCCLCVLQYLSSSSLDTPSLFLGDQSRGDGRVSSNKEELNTWFRVSSVDTRIQKSESPKNSLGVKYP